VLATIFCGRRPQNIVANTFLRKPFLAGCYGNLFLKICKRGKNIFYAILWYYCFDTAMLCSFFIYRRKEWWQGANPASGIDDSISNDRWEFYLVETVRE